MKRRLRFIFSLLASCLLGIYGFQAYWQQDVQHQIQQLRRRQLAPRPSRALANRKAGYWSYRATSGSALAPVGAAI
jgi:hypothetical protein